MDKSSKFANDNLLFTNVNLLFAVENYDLSRFGLNFLVNSRFIL